MSADPDRLSVAWLDEARTDLRGIDRGRALEILYCLDRYLKTRNGDVKHLNPPLTGFRLRCGDYRLFFKPVDKFGIEITAVAHRREAYR